MKELTIRTEHIFMLEDSEVVSELDGSLAYYLRKSTENMDCAEQHVFADKLLCITLEHLGFKELPSVFKSLDKWYE